MYDIFISPFHPPSQYTYPACIINPKNTLKTLCAEGNITETRRAKEPSPLMDKQNFSLTYGIPRRTTINTYTFIPGLTVHIKWSKLHMRATRETTIKGSPSLPHQLSQYPPMLRSQPASQCYQPHQLAPTGDKPPLSLLTTGQQ